MKTPVFILLFLLLSSLSPAKDAGAEARMPADVGRVAECYSVASLYADCFATETVQPAVPVARARPAQAFGESPPDDRRCPELLFRTPFLARAELLYAICRFPAVAERTDGPAVPPDRLSPVRHTGHLASHPFIRIRTVHPAGDAVRVNSVCEPLPNAVRPGAWRRAHNKS